MNRQQRRASERAKPTGAIVTEHVPGKGWRIRAGGNYLLSKEDGKPQFFYNEQEARDMLHAWIRRMDEQVKEWQEMVAKKLKEVQDAHPEVAASDIRIASTGTVA